MNAEHIKRIAEEMNLGARQVQAVAELLAGDATVPFIARYRKEATGSLDEVAVADIRDRLHQMAELDKRRESILKSLTERELLTDELKAQVMAAETMTTLEDVYLPYRPKRRTRATAAREKGLEPLAERLFAQPADMAPLAEAAAFVDPEKGVAAPEDALAGARDIIAELAAEHAEARARMRNLFEREAVIVSKVITGMENEGAKFRDYFAWEEKASDAPSHRVLAMRRGEAEGILNLKIRPSDEAALEILEYLFVTGSGPASEEVRRAVRDAWQRLLSLSMETEMRLAMKKRADAEAIGVFAENLKGLLLSPPFGQRRVMGIDPGLRTGCKVVCLNRQGQLLHHDTFYLAGSESARNAAAELLTKLAATYQPEAIAIGNGTGGRDCEAFVRGLGLPENIQIIMVDESGASVYSASESARAEFPDLDLTFRGAVSIGRRLMDPLAELVKIDPKSIGVGQYQHDVHQNELKRSLDDVVVSAVNKVGVELNTASLELLTYVSGLGPGLAGNILAHRNSRGPFKSRQELLDVPRLGPKAFEQAAGFLRIRNGDTPLDASAVHPESYPVVKAMAGDLGLAPNELVGRNDLRGTIKLDRYVTERVGMPTLMDILDELARPGRDPRPAFERIVFSEGVNELEDLKAGMRLTGRVTNVTNFGAFVDIGVHQDGLVHISELADRFVKDPHEVVRVRQSVTVTVLEVDLERRRIRLSMREQPETASRGEAPRSPEPEGRPRGKAKGRKEQPPKNKPFNNPFAKLKMH